MSFMRRSSFSTQFLRNASLCLPFCYLYGLINLFPTYKPNLGTQQGGHVKYIKLLQTTIRRLDTLRRCFAALILTLLVATFWRSFEPAGCAAQLQTVAAHQPWVAAKLAPVGWLANTTRLNLAICLPLRNPEALSNLLQQIYDPASPNYHHYLTPSEFAEQFGPSEADYQSVIAFAQTNGLTVTGQHPNRMLLISAGRRRISNVCCMSGCGIIGIRRRTGFFMGRMLRRRLI